jgi:tetratricopeptide (TPR) repeat protein
MLYELLFTGGMEEYASGNYAVAIADLTKSLSFYTDEGNIVGIYHIRGMSYYYTKDYRRAMADLEIAAKLNPKDDDIRRALDRSRRLNK